MIALVSDFLAPLDRLERNLVALTAGGHELSVFQVLDPVELNLGLEKASVFEDIESSRTLYIDPAAARVAYVKKLDAHSLASLYLRSQQAATLDVLLLPRYRRSMPASCQS